MGLFNFLNKSGKKIHISLVITKEGPRDKKFDNLVADIVGDLEYNNVIPQEYLKKLLIDFDEYLNTYKDEAVYFRIPIEIFLTTDEKKEMYDYIKHIFQKKISTNKKYKNYNIYNKIYYGFKIDEEILKIYSGQRLALNICEGLKAIKEFNTGISEESLFFNIKLYFTLGDFEDQKSINLRNEQINNFLKDYYDMLIQKSTQHAFATLKNQKVNKLMRSKSAQSELKKIKSEPFNLSAKLKIARNNFKKIIERDQPNLSKEIIEELCNNLFYLEIKFMISSIPFKIFEKFNNKEFYDALNHFSNGEVKAHVELTTENQLPSMYDWAIKPKNIQNN